MKNVVDWLEKQPAEQSASEEKRVRSDYFHLMWLHAVRFTIRRLIGILPWILNMCREIRQPSAVARKEAERGFFVHTDDRNANFFPDYIIYLAAQCRPKAASLIFVGVSSESETPFLYL